MNDNAKLLGDIVIYYIVNIYTPVGPGQCKPAAAAVMCILKKYKYAGKCNYYCNYEISRHKLGWSRVQ